MAIIWKKASVVYYICIFRDGIPRGFGHLGWLVSCNTVNYFELEPRI